MADLFLVCLKIGAIGFGGGLSGWSHRDFVDRRHWISDDEFALGLAMAQILLGPNVLNLVIDLGDHPRGPAGAAACALGLLTAPFFVVIAPAALLGSLVQSQGLDRALEGLAFAALGLLVNIPVAA